MLALSCVINLLGLVGAIYMMQVYDRVLSSGSVPTLVGISIIALMLYAFYGFLEYFRTEYLTANGESFADKHAERAFHEALEGHALDPHHSERRMAIEDLGTVRRFLTSKGYSAIFDVIWMPIFLIFIFSLHPVLGVTALVATCFLVAMALINERTSRKRIAEESGRTTQSRRWVANIHRHAHLVTGNGMGPNMAQAWLTKEKQSREESLNFSSLSSKFSVSSKTIRLVIQSMILGLGGFLAIRGHISPGAMIAASIVFTRTIAPVERLLANFALFIRARQSWSRMKTWIFDDALMEKIALPEPSKALNIDLKYLVPPGAARPVLQGVDFKLVAGDVLGVLGPSGSGKSSLAKALAGAWQIQSGSVSMDGADYTDWPQAQLGSAIGYMAQDCELFDGTVAQNICGFTPELDETAVLKAAQIAQAHEMIAGLENGYNTQVGPSGTSLSSGQRQRINLARALYGNPFIVVLDEPNSNLDEQGERALLAAIKHLKDANKIVVIVAHRRNALRYATKLCVIKDGTKLVFGPAQEVANKLKQVQGAKSPPQRRQTAAASVSVEKLSVENTRVQKTPPLQTPPPVFAAPTRTTADRNTEQVHFETQVQSPVQSDAEPVQQPAVAYASDNTIENFQPSTYARNIPPNPYLRALQQAAETRHHAS
jgi:PrtD family type I secretion system ABC transporter